MHITSQRNVLFRFEVCGSKLNWFSYRAQAPDKLYIDWCKSSAQKKKKSCKICRRPEELELRNFEWLMQIAREKVDLKKREIIHYSMHCGPCTTTSSCDVTIFACPATCETTSSKSAQISLYSRLLDCWYSARSISMARYMGTVGDLRLHDYTAQ